MVAKAFHLAVTSAFGSTLCPMGIVQCPFKLGGCSFEFTIVVCWNLTRPLILGLDFMCKHHIRLSWLDTGKELLTSENRVLVETINICEMSPQLMASSSLILPPRMLAVINVHVHLKENSTKHTYEVKSNGFLMDQYLNMVIMPVIHIVPMGTDTTIPFIIINLSIEIIFLAKHEVLGYLDKIDIEICEIMTSLVLEPLALEMIVEQLENPLPYREFVPHLILLYLERCRSKWGYLRQISKPLY